MKIEMVELWRILDNPFQPRLMYTGIDELAKNIVSARLIFPETKGLVNVPAGRQSGAKIQLADGHRRYRAFKLLSIDYPEYKTMPVRLFDFSNSEMDDISWSENNNRIDFSPIEIALSLKKTMDTRGLTQDNIAQLRGMARSTVANKLRLLDLPDDVQALIDEGKLSEHKAIRLYDSLKTGDVSAVDVMKEYRGTFDRAIAGNNKEVYAFSLPETLDKSELDKILEQFLIDADFLREATKSIRNVNLTSKFEVRAKRIMRYIATHKEVQK